MDSAVQLLKLLRGGSKGGKAGGDDSGGIRILRAVTTDPNPVTFVFEGTSLALDLAIFEVPVNLYPICKSDKFLASPLIGDNTNRWGVTSRINRGYTIGTMIAPTQCQVEGIGRPYNSNDLLIPPGIVAGDTVLLLPIIEGNSIKYAISQKF